MTMSASETYQQLVKKLYQSQLHFCLTETPFSAQIVIRKRFLKDQTGPSLLFSSSNNIQSDEVDNLNMQVIELEKAVQNSKETIEILENKVANAETGALKAFEVKKTEIAALKSSLKKSEDVIKTLRKDLEDKQKDVREKEKTIIQLEKKCENLNNNNKNYKTELTKAKKENKKLMKSKTESEKPNGSDSNQNLPASTSQSSSSHSTPLEAADSSPQSPTSVLTPLRATLTSTAGSRTARPSSSPTLPTTPPSAPPSWAGCRRSATSLARRTPPGSIVTAKHEKEMMIENDDNKLQSAVSPTQSQPSSAEPPTRSDDCQTTPQRSTSQPVRSAISADYILGINNIDLGPRVNDLSQF